MDALEAPYNYRLARVNRMQPRPLASFADQSRYDTKLDAFGRHPARTWEVVRLILAGIEHLGDAPISRVEAFNGRNSRGLMLFDNTGAALLYVPNALLERGKSTPTLSEQILTALGVSEEMLREACGATNYDHNYIVIFSREETREIEGGVEAAILQGELGEWTWWSAPLM